MSVVEEEQFQEQPMVVGTGPNCRSSVVFVEAGDFGEVLDIDGEVVEEAVDGQDGVCKTFT